MRVEKNACSQVFSSSCTEARSSQQGVTRHSAVFEDEIASAAAPDTHFVFFLAEAQAGRRLGYDEC